jgi:hypothetical protein
MLSHQVNKQSAGITKEHVKDSDWQNSTRGNMAPVFAVLAAFSLYNGIE